MATHVKHKVCVLGAYAVGKTSLVSRFTRGVFSPRYLTTVGVRVERKDVSVDGQDVSLMVWDIHGEDAFQAVRPSYLRGASACLLVVDGTRRGTLDTAVGLKQRVRELLGPVPAVVLLSKSDLRTTWDVEPAEVRESIPPECPVLLTSAKSGDGVEDAFREVAARILDASCPSSR